MESQGFSLIEVLLSLMLMASIALTLMQQQGSIIQSFNQLQRSVQIANHHYNQSEIARMQAS